MSTPAQRRAYAISRQWLHYVECGRCLGRVALTHDDSVWHTGVRRCRPEDADGAGDPISHIVVCRVCLTPEEARRNIRVACSFDRPGDIQTVVPDWVLERACQ